jgi:hypothetical protein
MSSRRGFQVSQSLRSQLAKAVERFGEVHVRTICGVSRISFARALGGLAVLAGTIALLEQGMARLAAGQAAPAASAE